MATKSKQLLEVLLVKGTWTALPEKRLLTSHNLGQVDLLWPRATIARKSSAREFVYHKGRVDFTAEPWSKRVLFREEVDRHCGFSVSITEPLSVQKIKRFVRLCTKYALKMGADFVEKAMVGYADIASAPLDAMAVLMGEKDAPQAIAQGVFDLTDELMPKEGTSREIEVPLFRPKFQTKPVGSLTLLVST